MTLDKDMKPISLHAEIQASSQVNGFMKHEYPIFKCGQDMGHFANATQENTESFASAASLSWLSKYYTEEMHKVSCDVIEDYIGILVAAVLSGTRNNNILDTVNFLVYRVPHRILGESMKTIKVDLLCKVTTEVKNKIGAVWRSCASRREQLILLIQHDVLKVAYNRGIDIETCKSLWKEVRSTMKRGDSIEAIISAYHALSPSIFEQNFETLRTRMEKGDLVWTSPVADNQGMDDLPASILKTLRKHKANLQDLQLTLSYWKWAVSVKTGPDVLKGVISDLERWEDHDMTVRDGVKYTTYLV